MKRVLVTIALFTALTVHASPEPNADVHNALRQLKTRMVAAMNRNDIDAMLAELHPDVVITWQNAEVSRGREAVRAYLVRNTRGANPIVKSYHADIDVDQLTALYGGDTGIAYGSSTERFDLRGGMNFTLHGRWSATMVNDHGRWLLASVHASSNLFDNPLVSATKKMLYVAVTIAFVVALVLGWFLGRRRAAA